jgi:hypothetical protein
MPFTPRRRRDRREKEGNRVSDLRKLSDLARAEINALRRDGVELTPDDVVRINALAWAVETPETRRLLARGVPVFLAERVALWPLTLYASEWFRRVGGNMKHPEVSTGTIRRMALAYAMAFGRSDGPELEIDGDRAARVVYEWAQKLKCTLQEIEVACGECMLQNDDGLSEGIPAGHTIEPGDLSAFMVATCGGSPELWERQVSIGYVNAVLTAFIRQNRADNKPSLADPKMRAERALGLLCLNIRNREKRKAESNG